MGRFYLLSNHTIKTKHFMTPLQFGLYLLVVALFCLYMDKGKDKSKAWVEILSGVSIILIFIDLIWAVFYYIKL